MYDLLRKRIQRKTYKTKEEMQKMLDLYFYNDRITGEEYDELSNLLEEKETSKEEVR